MAPTLVIDFGALEGPVFTGRPRGEALRKKLALDRLDQQADAVIEVRIPDATYSVSSSFILGLLGASVVHAGTREEFFRRFRISANALFQEVIEGCVDRALQAKSLFDNA
jgi:hypothetical protein